MFCLYYCLLLQKCKFSHNAMSSNPDLFLWGNIQILQNIWGLYYQKTRKAGSHYQILLLYNDFKSFHDTNKVPLTSRSQSDRRSSVVYTTKQKTSDLLGKIRAAQDQRDNAGILRVRYQKSYCEIRWDKIMSK